MELRDALMERRESDAELKTMLLELTEVSKRLLETIRVAKA